MNTTTYQNVSLPVMETFYSIQGEGANAGKAAYFIRLAGCDVGCHWCDVKDSWDISKHPLISIEELVAGAMKHPSRNVIITGGEPLQHDLNALCWALATNGFNIWLETSGAFPLSGEFDWICLSPKKFKAPLDEVYGLADELKVVVFNKTDFKWAEDNAKKVKPYCRLYLQPEWDQKDIVLPLVIDYVKAHPQWSISLQNHKYIHVP